MLKVIKDKKRFLDLFYSYYNDQYKDLYYDGITTEDMIGDLGYYCPGPYAHILKLHNAGY